MTGSYAGGAGQERAGGRRSGAPQAWSAARPDAAASPSMAHLTVEEAATSVVRAANSAASVIASYKEAALADARAARHHADARHVQMRQQAQTTAAEQRAATLVRLQLASAALAPGPLAARWDDTSTLYQPTGILDAASYVRVGSLRLMDSVGAVPDAPLLVPLLDKGNLRIVAAGDDCAVSGTVQEVVLRSLLGTGAGQLSLATFDPQLRGTTAPFTALRQVSDELVPPTLASPEELHDLLNDLSRDVRRISEMYEGIPTTLGEFRRAARQPIERYRLVILLNYPVGFDDKAHVLLRTLMRTGPACGISFVMHQDTTVAHSDGLASADRYPLSTLLRGGSEPAVGGFEDFQISLSSGPGLTAIEPAMVALQERVKEAAAPKISFSELQPPSSEYWRESSAERVTAIVGRAGHQPVEITLGDEREQRHNVLVSGAVGQGKSNLLMVLVHSWATRYAPDELDLYLLDFKDGVTLYPLAPHPEQQGWLPHARVLGLESDRAYGAAVLQHLVDEFERRAAIIRPYGDNITRYRQHQTKAHMPRIIVVIDEFQVLFEEDDELTRAALLNLERLAKKGRAYGIHLVLASQTLSGITAMLSKQDGIFAQFPIRLALKNSAGESRAVLDQHNVEAARLRYRGELIVNTDFGQVEANRRAVVALAEPAELAELRVELWRRSGGRSEPSVFNGGVPADLISGLRTLARWSEDESPRALMGMPVSVLPVPMGVALPSESGRHISIVGAGNGAGQSNHSAGAVLLQTAAVSLAYQERPGTVSFIVLNLLAARSPDQVVVRRLVEALSALGHRADVRTAEHLLGTLTALGGMISERRAGAAPVPIYLVAFGMDRAPNLRIPDPATFLQPIDALHVLWREGSSLGIHLLGWWSNVRSYSDQLGLEASGSVDVLALLRVSSQDLVDLLGPFISWSGPANRALVRDVIEAFDPAVIVPFAGITERDIIELSNDRALR